MICFTKESLYTDRRTLNRESRCLEQFSNEWRMCSSPIVNSTNCYVPSVVSRFSESSTNYNARTETLDEFRTETLNEAHQRPAPIRNEHDQAELLREACNGEP